MGPGIGFRRAWYSSRSCWENPLSKKWNEKHKNKENPNDHQKPTCHESIKWPSLYPVRIEKSSDDESRYTEEKNYKDRQIRIARWLNWITGGAAVVGLLGLVYLDGQLGAMREANNINRDALVSVQRAFINVGQSLQENAVIVPGQKEINNWEFRPRFTNSGATPTRNAHNHGNFLPWGGPLPEHFPFPDIGQPGPDTPFILGPKEDVTGALLEVPIGTIKAVQDKTEHLYFYGWITYEDIFPKTSKHISMFCIELTDVRGELKTNTPHAMAWAVCPIHNCADGECVGEPYGTPTRIWPNQ